MTIFSPSTTGVAPVDGKSFVQTPRGAVGFVQIANLALQSDSIIHLADGVTIKPNALGFFVVRTVDLQPLLARGYDVQGPSTIAAFQAGVMTGQGAGTAT